MPAVTITSARMSDRPRGSRLALLRDPGHLLAFGFGSGLLPAAPGTWGTVVAVPLFWSLSDWTLLGYLCVVVVIGALSVWVCGRTARFLGVHDDRAIVADEIVGFLVAMIGVPFTAGTVVLGFILFRAFDVLKPWPIGLLDRRLRGGLGIVADDVAAGIYAAVSMQVAVRMGLFGY